MNCFSGTAASVFKAPHYIFLSLSKKIDIKTILKGNSHAVPLGCCGPLRVMSGCLIIPAAISGFNVRFC